MNKSYNPCDDCQYSHTKQNQESGMCRYCEFKKYIDLEEQGLLLKLPCKVGTPVYNTTWWDDVTETITVKGTTYYRSIIKHKVSKSNFSLRDLDKFGKEVFLTKEEAEAKLRELERGEKE